MANVKFLQGTRAQYAAITPDINTFYAVTETDGKLNFYLGSLQLSQQAAIDVLNGADTVPGSVANAIKVAIADLKNEDAAVAHQFVTAVAESDGVVTVSRAALVADDIPTLTLAKISDAGTAAAANVATVAIEGEGEDTAALPTVAQIEAYVAAKVAGLAGAVHFRGIVTSLSEITDPKSGDMAIVGVKEYIYNGTEWQELGDEGAYVVKEEGKSLIADTEITRLAGIETGAQVNVLEGVQVNGTDLTITDKKVNVTVAEGATNGTVAVNGADVAVHGLGSAAYTDSAAYDKAGDAVAEAGKVLGTAGDSKDANTVFGAKAYAANVQSTVIGTSADDKNADTINGAKAYANSLVSEGLSWGEIK